MQVFRWTDETSKAAILLADGYTETQAATACHVARSTIARWKTIEEFATEVDRLSLMVGIANRAERLRLAKRIIRKLNAKTKRDLLDWVKFAQSETDGAKLDLATLAEAITSMADSGSGGDGTKEEGADAGIARITGPGDQ